MREEGADLRRDLRGVGLQREMAGVNEADDRVRDVTLERLGSSRQEERIIPAPHREQARPVVPEVLLEDRVERDVALVVTEQVELQLGHAGASQVEVVERVSVWRDRRGIGYPVRVLEEGRLRLEEGAQRLAVGFGRFLPVGPERVPAVA